MDDTLREYSTHYKFSLLKSMVLLEYARCVDEADSTAKFEDISLEIPDWMTKNPHRLIDQFESLFGSRFLISSQSRRVFGLAQALTIRAVNIDSSIQLLSGD